MIYKYKPQFKSLCYVSAFSEKAYYKVMKEYKIKRRDLATLILFYNYQQETNKLISYKALRAYSCYSEQSLRYKMDYYNRVGYIEEIRGRQQKSDKRHLYNLTAKGLKVIHKFNTLIGEYIKQFEEQTPKFKRHSPKLEDYYNNLGLYNSKKTKKDQPPETSEEATAND